MNIEGKSTFYVLCGIALTAVAVFVFCTVNSTSFPPLDLSGRLVRAEVRRKTHSFSIDSEQGRVMVLDITTGSVSQSTAMAPEKKPESDQDTNKSKIPVLQIPVAYWRIVTANSA